MTKAPVWFFVVDESRGRLFEASIVPPERLHLEERGAIENRNDAHEHGRPSPRAGKNGSSYASSGHQDEHERRRFARQIVDWMDDEVGRRGIETVRLFAPPRLLGELRPLLAPGLAGRVTEQQADLTNLGAAGLARHPAIAAALGRSSR